MSDRMERQTMQKFFDYIKGYNYVPSRNYAPPSHYDLQPYSSNYPLGPPTHFPKEPSFSEQGGRSGNPNFSQYFKNSHTYDYASFKQGMPSLPSSAPKTKNSYEIQPAGRGTHNIRTPSNIDPTKTAQHQSHGQINSSNSLYQMPGHGHPSSYGYPYMNYPGMNPYNPYCMYPPYYYNRPQMYPGSAPYPYQRNPQMQNLIKQEIVISSDSQENAVKGEFGYKKKNRLGYTVYDNHPPASLEKTNQLQIKNKSKQSKNQMAHQKLQQHQEKEKAIERGLQPRFTNSQIFQKEHDQQKMKLINQNKSAKAHKQSKLGKQSQELNQQKGFKEFNEIQEPKDIKESSRQKQQKQLNSKLNDKDQDEDNAQSRGKATIREDQPFYIKKKRICKQPKQKKEDPKLQNKKKGRQKDYQKIIEAMRRDKERQQNQNNEPKPQNFNQYCQRISAKSTYSSKSELKKQKSSAPQKEEKQNTKRERVRDDHPLRELRYSESHGRIRLGPYYQSSIPTLLDGEDMVSMRKQLQSKLRERQISAITF